MMTYGNMSLMEVNLNYSPPKAILEKLKADQEETGLSFQTLITIALNSYYNIIHTPQLEKSGSTTNGTKTEYIFTDQQ